MDSIVNGLIFLGLIVFWVGIGTWIFLSILLTCFSGFLLLTDFDIERIGNIFSTILTSSINEWSYAAIPLFILVGELVYRSSLSSRIFESIKPWVENLPGGLIHVNTIGCALFSSISGSSTATTSVIGKITIKELVQKNYDKKLSYGSLVASGGIGIIIPPSIVMIVYGLITETSILDLFAAGIIPGILIALMFSFYIFITHLKKTNVEPQKNHFTLKEKLFSLLQLWPLVIVGTVIFYTIFSGFVTPTESAATGIFTLIVILLILKEFSLKLLLDSFVNTLMLSCMICSIVATASLLSSLFGYMYLPQELTMFIVNMELEIWQLVLAISILYIILGLFIDGFSIMVLTLPLLLPVFHSLDINLIWMGIFLVILIEMSLITPPIGFNLFVLQNMSNEKLGKIAFSVLPFFSLIVLFLVMLFIFPEIATYLPGGVLND